MDNYSHLREKLSGLKGRHFWRSLDELAETDEFKSFVDEEFPNSSFSTDGFDRRKFLKLMGASLLLASLPGCSRQPLEKIVPYVKMPEEIIPGKPLYFATAMTWNRYATGLLVESHMGRPTKIEGNELHPDSLGATTAIQQASILSLYDPDRLKNLIYKGAESSWSAFTNDFKKSQEELKTSQGEGFRFLTNTVISPTLTAQIKKFLKAHPKARWHQYDAVNADEARKAQKAVLGEFTDFIYKFQNAETVLSLGSNFLQDHPGSLRYAKFFSKKRSANQKEKTMNRLYVLEAAPSLTGASADHLLSVKTSRMEILAAHIAQKAGATVKAPKAHLTKEEKAWVEAVSSDLKHSKGKSIVIAGDQAPASLHALAYALNSRLGNLGKTVQAIAPVEGHAEIQIDSLKSLAADLESGKVKTLVSWGINPAYQTPADLKFNRLLKKVSNFIYLSHHEDETSAFANWNLPRTHFLEHFSDGRASDGTVTTIQPLIEPLFGGISEHALLSVLNGEEKLPEDIVKDHWRGTWGEAGFDKKWRQSLHNGYVMDTIAKEKRVSVKSSGVNGLLKASENQSLEAVIAPDTNIWDGEFSNNAWLQELPRPFTKLTWDNAALLSPKTAESLGLQNEDVVQISANGLLFEGPVWVLPGHAQDSLTLYLGYGRQKAGNVGEDVGFNAYGLQHSSSPYFVKKIDVKKSNQKYNLVSTQIHHSMEGRDLYRSGNVQDFEKDSHFLDHHHHQVPHDNFYPAFAYDGYKWGMAVNLSSCIGCNSCVVACQSENNIPVVGKDQVEAGREMHWIRIDHYYEGSLDHPSHNQQPVMCMHCEQAPCEPVCPVGATTHSDEGINEMTYNRCVGTRYCANNCPYKVRRFNYFEYAKKDNAAEELMRNPDVTVRNRGVMEKCTFCIQKINTARITAEKENRKIKDGEVKTACQTSCPTEAIVFGDLNDKNAEVVKAKASPLNYGILTELNTQPRVSYQAKIKNPNPKLLKGQGQKTKDKAHH